MDAVSSDDLAEFLTEETLKTKDLTTCPVSPCKEAFVTIATYNWLPSLIRMNQLRRFKLIYKMYHGV